MTSHNRRSIRLAGLAGLSLAVALGACSSNGTSGKGSGGSTGSAAAAGGGGVTSAAGSVATGGNSAIQTTAATTVAPGGSTQPPNSSTSAGGTAGGVTTSSASTATGGSTVTGGSSATSVTTAPGGNTAMGGSTPTGGRAGGSTAPGGNTATGGSTPTGGRAGGSTAIGGTGGARGGNTVVGGTTASGGNAGGSNPTGGTAGAGGATASGGSIAVGDGGLLASESAGIHCFNWADPGDNFQTGALVLTGLAATDDYATVLASSNAIISGFKTVLNATAFRMPINETTVNTATTWAAYKGIFDAAISQNMKVIVAYWLPPGSNHIANMTTWNTMWSTVVAAYGTNDLVYFDVFNEPSGYSSADFITLVENWMTANPSVPANRVLVAGYQTDIDVLAQGAALPDCLLNIHIYDNNTETAATAEANLKTHVGQYYNRTVVSEYAGGTAFLTGLTTQMKAYGMGSCYWAGLEGTGGIAKLSGTAPNYTLTVNNAATLAIIQSGWTN